jgi:glycosyltransferase involved in cell wall biosynthesis
MNDTNSHLNFFKYHLKKIALTLIKLPGLRYINYIFVEVCFFFSRFGLHIFGRLRNHKENPWRNSKISFLFNKKFVNDDFQKWSRYVQFLREHLAQYQSQPLISILVPVYRPAIEHITEALESVELQSYENWQLCIVDDCSQSAEVDALLQTYQKKYNDKVRVLKHATNKHISETTNACMGLATGDYICLLDHDDRLKPNALAEMVRAIELHGEPDILYSDEEIIDADGHHEATVYKPAWSEFLHLSKNYTTHLSMYKTDFIRRLGGWRKGFEGAQDHDLMLRAVESTDKAIIHVPISLYQWRAHDKSTAQQDSAAKPYAADAGITAVTEACSRRGYPATVTFSSRYFQYRVDPQLPDDLPLVSIIIPNRNAHEFVARCLDSIFTRTSYKNFEVLLVDNGSTDERCFSTYDYFTKTYPGKFRSISDDGYFNFARLNNLGVFRSNGDFVVLLNSDTEITQTDWIENLLRFARIDQVGSVGCKLVYGNDNTLIQHAGIYGSGRYVAGNSAQFMSEHEALPLALNHSLHECLAVSGACLMIEKKKYLRAGGLEEKHVPNGFGDVLFGISLKKLGYVNLFTPYVRISHFESATRSSNIEIYERIYMCNNFPKDLLIDDYYNIGFLYSREYREDSIIMTPILPFNWVRQPLYRQEH